MSKVTDHQVKGEFPHDNELRVTVRLSNSPARYHLIEVIQTNRASACIQIKSSCSKEDVCKLAAHIEGLGTI